MKLNKVSFYQTLFMVVLLSQMYLPSFKFNIFFQLAVLGIYFYLEKLSVSMRLLKTLLPVVIIFFIGFLGKIVFKNQLFPAIKDIFHFIKPIQGILIGYFFFKAIDNTKVFIQTIVKTAYISAILHLLIILFLTDLASGSVHAIREFTKDNYLELIAIFFLGYYPLFFNEPLFDRRSQSRRIFIILLISCILYFSRTMMVASVVLFLSVYGYTRITKKSIKIIAMILLALGLLYGFLYSVRIDRGQPGLEAFLYKVKNAPEEIFKTKINREDHEELWDHWRGYEAKRAFALMEDHPLSFVFGTGYGSLVNLKFKAPLTSNGEGVKYISELHNGYPYVLYKTGGIGLLLYLGFLFGLYRFVYNGFQFENVFISALGIFYFFTTLTITGIYNTNDTTVFVLGALLFSLVNKSQKLPSHD